MSEQVGWKRGPGGNAFRLKKDGTWWWQASDGQWYPEETHPAYAPATPEPAPAPTQTMPAVPPPLAESGSPRPRRARKRGLWWALGLGVLAIVVLVAIFRPSGDDDDGNTNVAGRSGPSVVPTNPQATTSPGVTANGTPSTSAPVATANDLPAFAIGATATTEDFEVTVLGVTDPLPTDEFLFTKPEEGSRLITVDVRVANPTPEPRSFSSLAGFHIVDSENRQYEEEIATEVSPEAPEGEIPPGGALRGLVVFEVPESATGLRLLVQGSPAATGVSFTLD